MATYSKLPLSSSINGKQILITGITGSVSTPIHTSLSGTSSLDEVYLYAYNESLITSTLTIQWGGIIEPNDVVRSAIPSQSGRTLLVDGKLIQNGLTISAYATSGSFINVDGFVNRIFLP